MSDKTTAALAAEQADVEATTTQEPELLPAATLDELEQVDLGTVAEGERAPFRITDDRCADWAIRKIADERSEYDRLKALADEQIAAINEKVAAARKRMENGTSYLTSCLADFFATVPHKETKTTEKYRLLSGTLTFKKGTTKTKLDEAKLVPWLKANGYGELVKVEESTRWADLKKLLSYCHPYRPSERGSNENQNGLIRRHLPKGTDLSTVSYEETKRIEDWLNNYPRKMFGYLCSEQLFREEIALILAS